MLHYSILLLAGMASCSLVAPRQATPTSTPLPYPQPEPCYGPACTGFGYGDASIVISDGTYYRFSKDNTTGLGLEVATAPSLRGNWTYRPGSILSGLIKDSVAGTTEYERNNTNLWAPEIHNINKVWYLYYGVERYNASRPDSGFDIAVATSTSLDGPWTDQGSIGIPSLPPNSTKRTWTKLGATLLVNATDPSAQALDPHMLAFGSFSDGLYGIQMRGPPLYVATGAQPVELVADQPLPGGLNHTEGPYLYKRNETEYFIFYSRGATHAAANASLDQAYRIEVCRSTAAFGPYMDRSNQSCLAVDNTYGPDQPGTVLLQSHSDRAVWSPGSMGILNDPVEGLVMYYQYLNASTGTETNHIFTFNYLEFGPDGWPQLVQERPAAKK